VRAAIVPLALLAGLGGCHDPVRDPIYTRCSAIATSDWQARIVEGARPGESRPRLIVSGRVTTPTGRYRVELEAGPVERLEPPVQQVILRTTPARQGIIDAAVTHDVQASFGIEEGVERVTIRCGDGILALIPTIERGEAD
jgi:hypothetical protein